MTSIRSGSLKIVLAAFPRPTEMNYKKGENRYQNVLFKNVM
jgi:hypothetical protein